MFNSAIKSSTFKVVEFPIYNSVESEFETNMATVAGK